jgi:ribonucleoside-diphosphate reductase alpha chain
VLLSIALQYGIPLEKLVEKFQHVRFEPSGMTNDSSVPMATSFFDLLFKKLALKYLDEEKLETLGIEDRNTREDENGREERLTKGISGTPLNEKKDHESPIPEDFEGDEGKEAL